MHVIQHALCADAFASEFDHRAQQTRAHLRAVDLLKENLHGWSGESVVVIEARTARNYVTSQIHDGSQSQNLGTEDSDWCRPVRKMTRLPATKTGACSNLSGKSQNWASATTPITKTNNSDMTPSLASHIHPSPFDYGLWDRGTSHAVRTRPRRSRAIAIQRNTSAGFHDDLESVSSAERMYDYATWQMYNRIVQYRRTRQSSSPRSGNVDESPNPGTSPAFPDPSRVEDKRPKSVSYYDEMDEEQIFDMEL